MQDAATAGRTDGGTSGACGVKLDPQMQSTFDKLQSAVSTPKEEGAKKA